jgi:hypothetical protein
MDSICLSVDKDRTSWNGSSFQIDWEGFIKLVAHIDTDHKIKILEESFFSPERTPIANECYQRNRMAEFLGSCDWVVQLDADEIMLNGEEFMRTLEKNRSVKRPINIHGIWVNLIKKTPDGYVYSVLKTPPLATNKPVYEYGRTNGHFNIYTNTFLAHITWAREEQEVYYKLRNWGHSHEFNGLSFYKIWQALDDHNWKYIKDFHPMSKTPIPSLFYQTAKDLDQFIHTFNTSEHTLKGRELLNNNLWVSRFKKVFKRVLAR